MPTLADEESRIARAVGDVAAEINESVRENMIPVHSAHEGFAFIHEKMDKLKVHVWLNQKKRVPAEVRAAALRVVAAAVRFTAELSFGTGPVTALDKTIAEVQRARDLGFAPARSAHEGFAILAEEYDELKEHVWANAKVRDNVEMHKEVIQVAAMALRFAAEAESEEWIRR